MILSFGEQGCQRNALTGSVLIPLSFFFANFAEILGVLWRLNSLASLDIKRKKIFTAKLAKKSRKGRKAWNNEFGTLQI